MPFLLDIELGSHVLPAHARCGIYRLMARLRLNNLLTSPKLTKVVRALEQCFASLFSTA